MSNTESSISGNIQHWKQEFPRTSLSGNPVNKRAVEAIERLLELKGLAS